MKRNNISRIIKITAVSAALFGVAGIYNPVTLPRVQASRRYSSNAQYWSYRMHRIAKQRKPYHQPIISYNTRDLGGYTTASGKEKIKSNRLFRSDNLSKLTRAGAQRIKQLGINEIIDLRYKKGPVGINQKPDPGELGYSKNKYGLRVKYIILPTNTVAQENADWPIAKKYGTKYRMGVPFTDYYQARWAYHNFIKDVINHKSGALMFNCNQGRDRTGINANILEYGLGIPKHERTNDFMLTDYYSHNNPWEENWQRIDAFYTTVRHSYGTMNNYWHRGLKLNNNDKRALRKEYLVSTAKPQHENKPNGDVIQDVPATENNTAKNQQRVDHDNTVNSQHGEAQSFNNNYNW